MAKSAKSGEMRTRITVQALEESIDADGYQVKVWRDVFSGKKAWCKWVNAHGTEIYEQLRLDVRDLATITMRYTPLINVRCRVFKGYTPTGDAKVDDAHAYEVVTIDNVEEKNETLEIKVKRKVKA